MKQIFIRNQNKSNLIKFLNKFIHKVYWRLYRYFNFNETLLLKYLDRYKAWEIGDYTYGHPSGSPKVVYFGEDVNLKIGKFCSFAEDVQMILGGYHRTDWVTTYPFSVFFDDAEHIEGHPSAKGDIIIGNDVWICTGAIILSGVTIGNGSVVAARSVVTKDIPPYSIAAGNPAQIVKKRFSDEIIEKLEQIQWWDWSIEKIQREFDILLSPNVEVFVEKHFEDNCK